MELNNLLQRIDALKKESDSLPPITKEQKDLFDKKIKLEFHYNTNHIEGNTLTYGETDLLFTFGELRGNHTLREVEEMKASDVALMMVRQEAEEKDRPLTETFIKELNKTLLVEPYYKDAITPDGNKTQKQIKIGEYKESPNNVRLANGEIFPFASVTDTPIQMQELVAWVQKEMEKGGLHPLLIAATLHYRFVRIHPFDDGNGRVSRLLMNYVLYYNGYPPVVIKSADKKNYLNALHDADTGNLESFYGYLAGELAWSLELLRKAYRGESLEEEKDWEKELAVFAASFKGKKELREERNSGLLLHLMNYEISVLGNLIDEKLSKIAEMFMSTNIWFKSKVFDFPFPLNYHFELESVQNDFMSGIILNYDCIHFKMNGSYTFTVKYHFEWVFNDFDYEFHYNTINGKELIEKLYHEVLTDSEKNEILRQTAKLIIHDIEDNIAEYNSNL